MSSTAIEDIEVSKSRAPVVPTPIDEKHLELIDHKSARSDTAKSDEHNFDGYLEPTEDEIRTLRRVAGMLPPIPPPLLVYMTC